MAKTKADNDGALRYEPAKRIYDAATDVLEEVEKMKAEMYESEKYKKLGMKS